MDILSLLTIVTVIILFIGDHGVTLKLNPTWTSTLPGGCKCSDVSVQKGNADYIKSTGTCSASIQCSRMYTIDNTMFTCVSSYWTPTSPNVCTLKASSSKIMTSTPTDSMTSTLFSSESSVSSVIVSQGTRIFVTESPLHTTEKIQTSTEIKDLSSTLINATSSISHTTPFEHSFSTTATSVLESPSVITEITGFSSYQTSPSSINPSSASGQYTMSLSSSATLVVSPPAASTKSDIDDTDIMAAYIATAIAVLVIALLLVVGFLWWRRRNHDPSALIKKQREPGAVITNEVYAMNGIDRSCSLVNVRHSRVDEYAEISLDKMDSDKNFTDNYQTIGNIPEHNAERMKSYDNFKMSGIKINHGNYSHIESIQTPKDDKTYTHIPSDNVEYKPELSSKDDDDNTYNKLNTTTLTTNKVKQSEDTEYNHVHAGSQNSVDESDNYSHLGINKLSSGNPGKYEDYHENNGFDIGEEKSALSLSPKTEYDFARDFDELNASTTKQPNGASHLNETTNQIPTNYEFAKDFDNTSEYAKVTKQKHNFMKSQTENNDYETAVGTKHNYLILEPDTAANSSAFQVVGDEHDEKDEQNNEINSHEYFILEKTET